MGHIQHMTDDQRIDFISKKYRALKESRRGDSFPYWNEKIHTQRIGKGYKINQYETDNEKENNKSIIKKNMY